MTHQSSYKSTIVRTQRATTRLLFALAERPWPGSAARVAERWWFRVPLARPAGALPPGEDFTVRSQGHLVRGRHWGDGPTVYLVHGWGGASPQLAALVPPLVEAHFRVVSFDAPGHGGSDPGEGGPGTGHAVEFGRALDDVAARFGPAHTVVAHSMGAMATLLALKHGWLGTDRLVFLAPMDALDRYLVSFAEQLHLGPRVRERLDRRIRARVGYPVSEFDVARLAREIPRPPLLIVHDRDDRDVPYAASEHLQQVWPGATLRATDGLGHRRLLTDPEVIATVVDFVRADAAGSREPTQASIAAASSW